MRWYCKYGISYRELQEMLAERGVNVDHTTIYRWVQRYAPEIEKRLRWYWRNPTDLSSWHIDETYVKVNGRWSYLYRAVDQRCQRHSKIDPFYLTNGKVKLTPFDLVLSFNLGLNPNSFFILQMITLTRYLYHMTVMQ